jgi:hypothetical protein
MIDRREFLQKTGVAGGGFLVGNILGLPVWKLDRSEPTQKGGLPWPFAGS